MTHPDLRAIRERLEKAILYKYIHLDGSTYDSDEDVRSLLALVSAQAALLKRCEEMLRAREKDEYGDCQSCWAGNGSGDGHNEGCPYTALLSDLAAHDAEAT
ncbi:MAG: hypothetical protein IPH13_20205 [Planctomycetes bacterium]|nr:hypothetical protein [Planctomycetota bacterium]